MKNNIHGRDDFVGNKFDMAAALTNISMAFKKLFWIPVICAVLLAGASYFIAWLQYTPQYTCEATFTVEVNYGSTYSTDYYNTNAAKNLSTAFPYILQSTELASLAAEEMGEEILPATITASNVTDTNMFTLTAVGTDPNLTFNALSAVMDVYPKMADRVVGATTMHLIDEPVIPTEPSNASQEIAMAKKGGLVGLILSILLIAIYAVSRKTVQDSKFISKRMNIQCIGRVKRIKVKQHRKTKVAITTVNNPNVDYSFRESFRGIRTKVLRKCHKNGGRVILVTSTFPGEGKTTCAINLAVSIAETGKKVILADCDLRKNSVLEDLRMKDIDNSIEEFISGRASIDECLYFHEKAGIYVMPSQAKMYEEAAEVAASDDIGRAIEELRGNADYVIIDTSPMELMSDAISIAEYVDGAIFVVRYNYGKSRYVLKAAKELAESGTELFGYIFNGVDNMKSDSKYGSYGVSE